jgi:hypothetical protein
MEDKLSGEVLLLSHNGLGDNITMIGALNYLLTCYDKVYFICKDHNEKNLKLLLDDRIILQPFNSSNELVDVYKIVLETPPERDILISGDFYTRFTKLSTRITNQKLISRVKSDNNYTIKYEFIRKFYHVINLDLTVYYDYFKIPSNQDTEYYYNLVKNYKIIFMHTRASNSKIKLQDVIDKYKYNKDYIIICSNKNIYKNYDDKYELADKLVYLPIYHYIDIIKNAEEIHVIDSCFTCIVYPMYYANNKQLNACLVKIYDRPENKNTINTNTVNTVNKRNIFYLQQYDKSLDYEITYLIKNDYGCYINNTRKYDNYLNIKPEYIIHLNKIKDDNIDQKSMKILNKCFTSIFVDLTVSEKIFNQIVKDFDGFIYFKINSCDILNQLSRYKIHNRTYFIFSNKKLYEHENEISNNYFVNISLVYKIGITNNLYFTLSDKYKYTKKKKIGSPYRDNEFLKYFDNYEHDKFSIDKLSEYSCIYYNNNNIYTIDFFILEAIVMNIPIIFHADSYLINILPNSPGLSKNILDARNTIDRIISGDCKIIDLILEEQKKIIPVLLDDKLSVNLK